MTSDADYVVVGGGIAGLTAALSLVSDHGISGETVTLLESSSRVGGCLRPIQLAGQVLDAGPDALLTRRPEGIELLQALALESATVHPATGKAYLADGSQLLPYPSGLFLGVPTTAASVADTSLLTEEGRGRAEEGFNRPFPPAAADVTVRELVSRRWGDEVADRLAGPLIAAVHAGRADYLSGASCAPQLFPDARPPTAAPSPGGSPFVSLSGGLWQLAVHLQTRLEQSGVRVATSVPVTGMERRGSRWVLDAGPAEVEADRIVLAAGAARSATLLAPVVPDAARGLAAIEHASVAMVAVLLDPGAVFPEGSGFLVPPDESQRLLTACTWYDQKWPGTTRPDGRVVRLSAGRHGDERFAGLQDDDLAERLTDELGALTGQRLTLVSASVTRCPGAFPQYAVGHFDRVAAIRRELRSETNGTVGVAGNAFDGVGIPAVIGSARAATAQIAVP